MAITATMKSSSIHAVLRLALCCCSKKSTTQPVPPALQSMILAERNLDRLALLGGLGGLEQGRLLEAAEAGDEVVREALDCSVVAHDCVVVGLARERNLALGPGQLFGELHHGLIGLEVGIRFGHRKEPAERAGKAGFRR